MTTLIKEMKEIKELMIYNLGQLWNELSNYVQQFMYWYK